MQKSIFTIILVCSSLLVLGQSVSDSSRINVAKPEAKTTPTVSQDTENSGETISDVAGNKSGFFPAVDLRSIDGLFLGLGYKIVTGNRNGASGIQKISAMKNFKSEAFQAKYSGVWTSVFNNTDFIIGAFADVKGNIINYFGRGNETIFDQSDGFQKYYRAKFSLFQLDPAFRYNFSKSVSLTFGPSFQYSTFRLSDNNDRFIGQRDQLIRESPLEGEKLHAGGILSFNLDTRDEKLLPSRGLNFSFTVQGYSGLNSNSGSFAQAFPQLSLYKSLDRHGKFVLAERLGAGFTSGETAFYQNAFLGSQDNLLGFRKFRFAGDNLVYNNLEARITLAEVKGKKIKGRVGITGFYDAGRVWIENDESSKIHQGYGGGIFASPMNRALLRLDAGFSEERMQITAAIRQRF